MAFFTPVMEHWLELEIGQWVYQEGSIQPHIAPCANALTTELCLILSCCKGMVVAQWCKCLPDE